MFVSKFIKKRLFTLTGICILGIGLFALESVALPANAQDSSKSDASGASYDSKSPSIEKDKTSFPLQNSASKDSLDDLKVGINSENESLIDTLIALLKSVKADFVIDASLKPGKVSIHIKETTFKRALELILKVSTVPFEWEQKDNIFHFKLAEPKEAEKPTPPPVKEKQGSKSRKEQIHLENADPKDVLDKLLGNDQNRLARPNIQYELGGGGGRVHFSRFINGRLIIGNASSDKNEPQGVTQSPNLMSLLSRLLQWHP